MRNENVRVDNHLKSMLVVLNDIAVAQSKRTCTNVHIIRVWVCARALVYITMHASRS